VALDANYCQTIIDTKVDYICGAPIGITVLSTAETEARAREAEEWLYDAYRANRLLYYNMIKAIRIMAKKGDVFVQASYDVDGEGEFHDKLKVRVLKPDNCYPKYADDDYEEMELVAIKRYSYTDAGDREWSMQVWYPDIIQKWIEVEVGVQTDTGSVESVLEWQLQEVLPNPYNVIPIVHIPNIIDDREFGISDLRVMTKLQDAFNKTLTDLSLVEDYQAFQRVMIIGGMMKPDQVIDVSPGSAQIIPNDKASVVVIEAADLKPFVDVIEVLKDTISEVTRTPRISLGSIKGTVPSGFALRVVNMPLESKCAEAISLLKQGFSQVNKILFAIGAAEGEPDYTELDTEMQFTSGLPIDETAIVEKHEKQLKSGTISQETAMQEEGIEDVDAEKAKIRSEQFDVYGGVERAVEESEALAKALEGEQLFGTPAPEEVSEREL